MPKEYYELEELLAMEEKPESIAELRARYYAAEAKKAKARKAREPEMFAFYAAEAKALLARLP